MDGSLSTSRYGPAESTDSAGYHSGRRGNHDNYRGRDGGRDRGSRDHRRYNHRGGRGGGRRGPRPPSNRFDSNQTAPQLDPQAALRQQLAEMIARVGEFSDTPPSSSLSSMQDSGTDGVQLRGQMITTQENITDLTAVLCAEENAPMFLKFEKGAGSPKEAAGPLVDLIINCAATLPLQTPAYAGLTLAMHKKTPPDFIGFADRCVEYTLVLVSQYFDQIIQRGETSCVAHLLLLLRYLALLGKANLVEGYNANHIEDPTTLMGLLLILVKAATKTADINTSIVLRACVLHTLPYTLSYIPLSLLSIHIANTFQDDWQYDSVFAPGVGAQALLLKTEQNEGMDGDEDDNDEEEEEDDDENTSEQVCDSLQDLIRCVNAMVHDPGTTTRFTLFTDAPWEEDTVPTNKIRLSFLTCKSIPAIFNNTESYITRPHGWEGSMIFGRLPIFGAPDGDDDDDDDDLMEEKDGAANVYTQAYEKNFNILDRYFVADAVRNCLICHQSAITDAGVTRGSAKDVAQQIWSVSQLLHTSNDSTMGIAYIIVETLLPLILQSFDSHYLLGPFYVSRVLLELVRAQPAVMPQALAVGVSNLFDSYLPSLVPSCRDNFSRWLAFHLTNTDYQWPKAYWDHWARFVTESRNSRGDFVTHTLELMAESLSSVGVMVSTCLPPGSQLSKKVFAEETSMEDSSTLGKEVRERIWERNEDPDQLQALVEGNLAEESGDIAWWRTQLLIRSLLQSVENHREQQRKRVLAAIAAASSDDAIDAEPNEPDVKEDVLVKTIDGIIRYQGVIRACIQNDLRSELENDGSITEAEHLAAGQAKLVETFISDTRYNRVLLAGCLKCLLDYKIVEPNSVVTCLISYDSNPSLHWWNLAIMTIRIGLDNAVENIQDHGGAMVIDRDGDGTSQEGDAPETARLIEYGKKVAGPLIQNTLVQVCRKLSDVDDPKTFTPVQVDLVEGLKRFVVASRLLIYEALTSTGTKPVTAIRAMDLITSSFGLSGAGLASICREGRKVSNGVEAVAAIFDTLK